MAETEFDDQLLRKHVKSRSIDEVMSLLRGADPCHFVGKFKTSLLHLASEYGNKDLAQYLIDLGANVNAQNNIGETPLVLAVKHGHEEVVNILLKSKADLCIPDIFDKCVLRRALDEMEEIDDSIRDLLLNSTTVEYLRKNHHTWTRAFHERCPLYTFVLLKNTELMRLLLERGSPVNAVKLSNGRTALHEAVSLMAADIVKLLVEHGADVNARCYSRENTRGDVPLALISENNNDDDETSEILEVLLNANSAFINHHRMGSLLSRGGRKLVRAVLKCNVDLYGKDEDSKMPIDYLLEKEDPGVYEELKSCQIDVNMRFDKNATLLHRVAGKGNPIAVQFLIERGADVNAKDNDNLAPLHMAADSCTNSDRQKNILFSPFTYAENQQMIEEYWMRRCDCVSILLENGADPQIISRDIDDRRIRTFSLGIGVACDLMKPVLIHLALHQASGRAIDQFMLTQIDQSQQLEAFFDSTKQQLERLKLIKIGGSVNLFDFLITKRVSRYAHGDIFISNLTEVMKEFDSDSYYYRILQKRFLKLAQIVEMTVAMNEIFVKVYNISAVEIAERIVDYL